MTGRVQEVGCRRTGGRRTPLSAGTPRDERGTAVVEFVVLAVLLLIPLIYLVMVMARVSKEEYGLGSTLWNAAFDAGTGLGAFLFGFVIEASGFSSAFYLCAMLLLAALVIVRLDRAASSST